MKQILSSARRMKRGALLTGGCLLYALAVNLFLAGNNIAAGGLAGIATVLSGFLGMRMSVLIALMNIPLLILGLVIKGRQFIKNTLLAFVIYTIFIEVTSYLPTLTDNPLVAAVFGGGFYGIGMAAMSVANGSIGGTELIVRVLAQYLPGLGIGKISLLVDGAVVLFSMVMFRDIEIGLYAIITLYVSSYFADNLLLGFDRGNLCFMITDKPAELFFHPLMNELNLSVTKVPGFGMFTGSEKTVLLSAVHSKETPKLKKVLSVIDPECFVVIAPISEVLGGRFKSNGNQ